MSILTLIAPADRTDDIGLFGPGTWLNDDGFREMAEEFESEEAAKEYLRARVPVIAGLISFDQEAALAEIETGSLTILGLTAHII